MTMTHFLPNLSVMGPATNAKIKPITELMVSKAATWVRGRLNRFETYSIKNGQIMEDPVVLISIPEKSSQN
jgi:glycine cleavage system regulatory protein